MNWNPDPNTKICHVDFGVNWMNRKGARAASTKHAKHKYHGPGIYAVHP